MDARFFFGLLAGFALGFLSFISARGFGGIRKERAHEALGPSNIL
jgi:hypothetical protein